MAMQCDCYICTVRPGSHLGGLSRDKHLFFRAACRAAAMDQVGDIPGQSTTVAWLAANTTTVWAACGCRTTQVCTGTYSSINVLKSWWRCCKLHWKNW